MLRARFIGGLILVVAAVLLVIWSEIPVPVTAGLGVVGIALIATARRGMGRRQ